MKNRYIVQKLMLGLAICALLVSGIFLAMAAPPEQARNDDVKLKVFVHNPKPVATGTCTNTSNNGGGVNDYGLAGWHLPAGGITYKINNDSAPVTGIQTPIEQAFATWTLADSDKKFVNGGSTTIKTAKRDGQNIIAFRGIQGSAIAITYVWYYTRGDLAGQVAEVDTLFNKNLLWSINSLTLGDCGGTASTYDVQNIATHEFGHWVGLDDLYDSIDKDLTMYGYGTTGELKKDSLGTGDITGTNTVAP